MGIIIMSFSEYIIKRRCCQPPGEIGVILNRGDIDSWAMGPSDPNEKVGISPSKGIKIKLL